jgi:AbrB family looped-hinge helix DNA binding protein
MRVTSKGQVTIPQNVRETLGITPQTEIQFVEDNGKFYLVKVEVPENRGKFSKLRGIATAKMSTDEILALTRDE